MKKTLLLLLFAILFTTFLISMSYESKKSHNVPQESISEVQTEYNYSNPELTIETVEYTGENSKPIKVAKCQGCHWKSVMINFLL